MTDDTRTLELADELDRMAGTSSGRAVGAATLRMAATRLREQADEIERLRAEVAAWENR